MKFTPREEEEVTEVEEERGKKQNKRKAGVVCLFSSAIKFFSHWMAHRGECHQNGKWQPPPPNWQTNKWAHPWSSNSVDILPLSSPYCPTLWYYATLQFFYFTSGGLGGQKSNGSDCRQRASFYVNWKPGTPGIFRSISVSSSSSCRTVCRKLCQHLLRRNALLANINLQIAVALTSSSSPSCGVHWAYSKSSSSFFSTSSQLDFAFFLHLAFFQSFLQQQTCTHAHTHLHFF